MSFLDAIRHLYISHNAPYLPAKIFHNQEPMGSWHNLCFSFPLGITAVPREIKNNAYAKFAGQIRRIMGYVQVPYYHIYS